MVSEDKQSQEIFCSDNNLLEFRLELGRKLTHLSDNIQAEVLSLKPIQVKKIQNYQDVLKGFQNDLVVLKKRLETICDIERALTLKMDIISLENTVRNLLLYQVSGDDTTSDYKIGMVFLKIRSRAISVKIKKDYLSYELNNMNLAFVYGLKSLIQKDVYIQEKPELLDLTFAPRGLLGRKAAFVLMRVRAKNLVNHMSYYTSPDVIKDEFVEAFRKMNNNFANSDAVRLQKLKNFVKFARLAKQTGESLKPEDIIAKIKSQSA